MNDKPEKQKETGLEEDGLGLFFGKNEPDCKSAWKMYQQGRDFNTSINLEDTVQKNENFFIGE